MRGRADVALDDEATLHPSRSMLVLSFRRFMRTGLPFAEHTLDALHAGPSRGQLAPLSSFVVG
jgi:hypothetical protein